MSLFGVLKCLFGMLMCLFSMVMMVMEGSLGLALFIGGGLAFYLTHPAGRGGHALEVEQMGVEEFVQVHFGVVAFDNLRLGLQGADDLLDALPFFGLHFRSLVQQDDVAELNLLDDEVLNVFLVDVGAGKGIAARKFILQAQSVHHGDDAIQAAFAVLDVSTAQGRDGADGLCDGFGLADAAGLDDDVVKALQLHQLEYLFDEVGLQGAADATVLQGHEAVVFLSHDTPLLDEVGVDVHLADVVDNNGKLDAALVGKDMVYQSRFPTAQITGQEQYRDFFYIIHSYVILGR